MAVTPPKILTVKAGPGRTVRLGGLRLTDSSPPAQTPWSLYVLRRLACDDLVEVPDPAAKTVSPATAAAIEAAIAGTPPAKPDTVKGAGA